MQLLVGPIMSSPWHLRFKEVANYEVYNNIHTYTSCNGCWVGTVPNVITRFHRVSNCSPDQAKKMIRGGRRKVPVNSKSDPIKLRNFSRTWAACACWYRYCSKITFKEPLIISFTWQVPYLITRGRIHLPFDIVGNGIEVVVSFKIMYQIDWIFNI